ncbi:MAG: YkgJ family cysteine cluster protein [Planctomycetaceae bacterium]
MARPGVILPILQNWSCHNCGGCCREHQIVITADEKKRIDRQQWTAADGVADDRPLIVALGTDFRLNHQADGACVFLDERGLCRIHAKFGEAAKPLACRAYPYAVHPSGSSVTVSLRFSCPSVVQNLGEPVAQQRQTLEDLAREFVPSNYQAPGAPPLFPGQPISWPDVMRLLAFVERGLSTGNVSFATRLLRVLTWIDLLEKAPTEAIMGDQLGNLLPVLHEASVRAQPDDDLPLVEPTSIGRTMFRQWVAQLLRHDTDVTARGGFMERMRLLSDGVRFTLGRGRVPAMADPISVRVAFSGRSTTSPESAPETFAAMPTFFQLENEFGGRNSEFEELFVRYFRVKLQGLHFCGRAFYDMPFIDGFRSLALMYPATLWVARMRAARDGRTAISLPDVQAALATIDHNFGYSPALGMAGAKKRIQRLARMQQITAFCSWYSR